MSSMTTSNGGKRLLRIEFKDPNEDYVFTHDLSNHGTLVCNRKNPLQLAVVRESYSPAPLQMLLTLSQIQHPNIADVLDVYFNRGRLSIVSEYLDVSLLELQLKALPLEEWELATIISEIIKGMLYVLDTVPSCDLYIDSVRVSLNGDVKLVPDLHYQKNAHEDLVLDHHYNSAFITGILETIMSQDTSSELRWSKEALEFSSLPPSDSLDAFTNHIFMRKAVSSSRLIPRIRLAASSKTLSALTCTNV